MSSSSHGTHCILPSRPASQRDELSALLLGCVECRLKDVPSSQKNDSTLFILKCKTRLYGQTSMQLRLWHIMPQTLKAYSQTIVCSIGLTSLFQSIVAVTLLSELQKGQENDTSSFGLCFLGGGFDDFLLPMGQISGRAQCDLKPFHVASREVSLLQCCSTVKTVRSLQACTKVPYPIPLNLDSFLESVSAVQRPVMNCIVSCGLRVHCPQPSPGWAQKHSKSGLL